MGIGEIVSVIAILLCINIAEYTMKRYRNRHPENSKRKERRSKEKEYMIVAPDILKVGLPCACFSGVVTTVCALSQIYNWEVFEQMDRVGVLICLFIFGAFTLLGIVLAAYGYIWKIEFDESGIIYQSAWGRIRRYKIENITRYTEKRRKQYKFYQEKKKLFQYETDADGDVFDLPLLLRQRGLYAEELIPPRKEHCIVETMAVQRALPILGLIISLTFIAVLFGSGDGKGWMYLLLGSAAIAAAYYTGDYLCDKTEIKDKIYRKQFLKKTKIVEFSQITSVKEYKSKGGKEYIIIKILGDKPLKIRRHNENINILLDRLDEEKKRFTQYGKKKKNPL